MFLSYCTISGSSLGSSTSRTYKTSTACNVYFHITPYSNVNKLSNVVLVSVSVTNPSLIHLTSYLLVTNNCCSISPSSEGKSLVHWNVVHLLDLLLFHSEVALNLHTRLLPVHNSWACICHHSCFKVLIHTCSNVSGHTTTLSSFFFSKFC